MRLGLSKKLLGGGGGRSGRGAGVRKKEEKGNGVGRKVILNFLPNLLPLLLFFPTRSQFRSLRVPLVIGL